MQNRLQLCSVYLKEVDDKLIDLQQSIGDDSGAKSTIIEALGFIEQAHRAVSQAQQHVEALQRAPSHSVKRKPA